MFRILILFAPVLVCLFWGFALTGEKESNIVPRRFLSKFMFVTAIAFFIHFLYFTEQHTIFPYFESILAFTGLLAFPMYHIYFRLLTVDKEFSFKQHYFYFIIPVFFFIIYTAAILSTPREVYTNWLINNVNETAGTALLQANRSTIRVVFVVQTVLSVIANYWLIKKYGHEAAKFYSDFQDGENRYSKLLNLSMIGMGLFSIVAILAGRMNLFPSDLIIYLLWINYTVCMFIIGNLGNKLKLINPSMEDAGKEGNFQFTRQENVMDTDWENSLHDRILKEFSEGKAHLKNQLSILDISMKLGTNRTYVSMLINQKYNQNFCAFVNGFRILELENLLVAQPGLSNEEYAELCGFGSVSSMKRALQAKTGKSLGDFKQEVLNMPQPIRSGL